MEMNLVDAQKQWYDRNGWPLDLNAVYAENEFKGDSSDLVAAQKWYMERLDGGPGSGNWGHSGRPGIRGGSGAGGGAAYRLTTPSGGYTGLVGAYKENKQRDKNKTVVGGSEPEKKEEPEKKQEAKVSAFTKSLKSGKITPEDVEKAEKGDTVAWSGGAKPMNLIKVDDDTWVSIENGSMFTNKDVQTRIENGHESDFTESKYSGLNQNEKLNSAFSSSKDVDDVHARAIQNIGGLPVGSIYTDDKGHAYVKLENGYWEYQGKDGEWRSGGSSENGNMAAFRIANSYAESKGWEPKNIARVALEKSSIENRPIKKRETSMTENDIIRFVAGGDETVGSCASAALAYVGDKAGFEVRDFRDGDSRKFFSLVMNNKEVLKIGKGYREEADFNEKDAAVRLLNSMEEGKQYVLGTGRHMSVVKKEKGDFMYFELQSSGHDGTTNGWHSMKKRYGTVKKALTGRFGCVSRGKFAKFGVKQTARMVDIDALGKSKEFQKILGYLNTAEGKEKKGVSGHIA